MELALISPMLMILLAGIIDFGRAYREEIELSSAVAAAAQYALLNAANINSTSAAALAATLSGIVANANGAAWAGATVTVNDGASSAVAGGSDDRRAARRPTRTAAGVRPAYPGAGSGVRPLTCGTACAGGRTLAGKFVTIAGTRSFTAIFTRSYGLIGDITLHQSTIVQAQ